MFGSIGMPEMIVIFVIALLIFGTRKLPQLGRSLGRSINEFKKASNELRSTLEEEIRVEETKEQKAKIEAEQQSAVTATQVQPDATPASAAPPSPTSSPETTVSRTGTGHPA